MPNPSLQACTAAALILFLPGCTSNDTPALTGLDPKFKVAEAPTVAVLPFTLSSEGDEKEAQLHEFEKLYFPARLIAAMRAERGIADACFTPTPSPAADINITGAISVSNGRRTAVVITAKGADGQALWTRSFVRDISSGDFSSLTDPASQQWAEIAKTVAATPVPPGQFAVARVSGFVKQPATGSVSVARLELGRKAAEVERQRFFKPITQKLLDYAQPCTPKYVEWQKIATPMVEARSQEKAAQVINFLGALAGAAGSAYGARTGNTELMTQGQNTMTTAMTNMEVSGSKIEELSKSLSGLTTNFNSFGSSTLSVELFNRVYTFRGTLDKQQRELHDVVGRKLSETL